MEQCEIITIPESTMADANHNLLSDDDLFNLVMGVVNLVKRNATPKQIHKLLDKLIAL